MEFARSDIRNIAFEAINDRFSKGKYLGVEVTIDMTNGYINGPHLVGQVKTRNGKSKRIDHWRETKESKELVKYLTSAITGVEPVIDVMDVASGLRGTYIHPRLVSHVAQWASPIFADKVAVILNNHAINEAIVEKNKLLQEKEDKIDILQIKIDEQNRKIDELLGYARKADEDLEQTRIELECHAEESKNQIETVSLQLDTVSQQLETVQEKLEISVERRVPRDPIDRRNEVFAVYRKPESIECKFTRCQYRSWATSKRRCNSAGYTEQIYFREDPNAVNICNRVKEKLPESIGRVKNSYYIILRNPGKTSELTTYIDGIEGEKREIK